MSAKMPWYPVTKGREPISQETKAQLRKLVENSLTQGLSQHLVIALAKQNLNVSKTYTKKIIDSVREQWAEEEKESRPANKAVQVRRIEYHIQKAREDKNWSAIASFERLLADIQGTKEPLEVNLNIDQTVTEATMHVIAQMTPEQIKAMVESQKRLREGASKALETKGEIIEEKRIENEQEED